jgi:hypothetical protein
MQQGNQLLNIVYMNFKLKGIKDWDLIEVIASRLGRKNKSCSVYCVVQSSVDVKFTYPSVVEFTDTKHE